MKALTSAGTYCSRNAMLLPMLTSGHRRGGELSSKLRKFSSKRSHDDGEGQYRWAEVTIEEGLSLAEPNFDIEIQPIRVFDSAKFGGPEGIREFP
jgi:hypothetical protein